MKIIGPVPNRCYLAFSGGGDSCAALSFLFNGRKDVELLYFNHGTEHAKEAQVFACDVAQKLGLKIHTGNISDFREKETGESKEEFWRNARYDFFSKFTDRPIITVHHLDDCVETWLFTSLHGNPKVISYCRKDVNVIRPFIASTRNELISFLLRNGPDILQNWVEDPSNEDVKYMRNLIRHEMVETAMKVNPGLYKVIRKKVVNEFNNLK